MAFNLGYLVAYSVILAALLMGPLVLEFGAEPQSGVEQRQAAVQLLYLHARILPAIALALCVFAIHGIFFSHRIAGPLYRFKQIFRSVKAGDVPSGVHLREKDFLQDEALELGHMLTSLRTRLGEIRAHHERLEHGWALLQRALHSGRAEDIDQRLAEVEAALGELGLQVARYEVGPISDLTVDASTVEEPAAPLGSDTTRSASPKT